MANTKITQLQHAFVTTDTVFLGDDPVNLTSNQVSAANLLLFTGNAHLVAANIASNVISENANISGDIYSNNIYNTNEIITNTIQLTGGIGTQGLFSWNADEETVDLVQDGTTLQLGQEVHVHVRNDSGNTLLDGTVVMATGTLGESGRVTIGPMISDGSIPPKFLMGITTETIPHGEDGKITSFGKVRGIDLSAYQEGDILYPDPAVPGAFTNIHPEAPNLKAAIAFVVSNHFVTGTMMTRVGNYTDVHDDASFHLDLDTIENEDFFAWNNVTRRFETANTHLHYIHTNVDGNATANVTFENSLIANTYETLGYGVVIDSNGDWQGNTVIGFTGSQGYTGSQGGTGSQGVIGYTGSKGIQGAIGYTGSQGITGVTGFTGSQGIQGIIGYTGSKGATGTQGIIGFTGSQGVQGIIGFTGSKGDIGYTGSKGDQGITGFTGSASTVIGYTGSQGDQGIIGYTGSKGDLGFTGSQGFIGSAGTPGSSASFFPYKVKTTATSGDPAASYILYNNATQTDATQINMHHLDVDSNDIELFIHLLKDGDTFIIQDDADAANYQIFTVDTDPTDIGTYDAIDVTFLSAGGTGVTGFSNDASVSVILLTTGDLGYTGSQGPIGYTGSQGIIGFTGSQGDQGVIGYTGSKGDQGVIGFTGSKGVIGYTGSKGDQGVIGYTGSQGIQGVIGFTGSQGTQGIQGVIGYTGSKGDTGSQGTTGYTGSKGDTGTQGVIGYIGSKGDTGSQGVIGYTGSKGDTGSQGVIGYTGSQGSPDTAAQILAKLVTVDGSGSNLDADKLDGVSSASFIRSDADTNVIGHTEWQDTYEVRLGSSIDFRMYFNGSDTFFDMYSGDLAIRDGTTNRFVFRRSSGNLEVTGTVDGRDIATDGSTLDAVATTYLPVTGGTIASGILNINTNTNVNTLDISRTGSSSDQVMKIGITDREATFKYIEDTSAEGSGNFGAFRFVVDGNLGEAEVTTLLMDHNNISYKGQNIFHDGYHPGASISTTPPVSPSSGDLWFEDVEGTLSIYYTDVDSSQWVVTSGASGAMGYTGSQGSGYTGSASTVIGYTGSKGASGLLNILKQVDATGRSYSTTWALGMTWDNFTKQAGSSVLFMSTVPMRNDSTGWGGGYARVEYAIDGGTVWTSLGDTGYDVVMGSGASLINHWSAAQLIDLAAIVSATQVRFRFQHKAYDGTLKINLDDGITDGPAYAFGNTQLTLIEIGA